MSVGQGASLASLAILLAIAPAAACSSPGIEQRALRHPDTEAKVKQAIVEILNIAPGRVTTSARLVEDLGADSLDYVEIVMAIEESLGISVADNDVAGLKTVGELVAYADKRRK